MKKLIPPVKGTRDFYPEQMAVRNWLYGKMREVSRSYGYQEYEAPILESLELYAAKSGDELVKQQSYVFKDRGGSEVTLRPELTPSLARMVAQRQKELSFPLRWWSFGPFWRYERPQKGRSREFFQWNVDLLGVDTPEADAEIVAVLASFFRSVALTPSQVLILVGSRKQLDEQLASMKIPEARRPSVTAWIDRRGKLEAAAWRASGEEGGLIPDQIQRLEAYLEDERSWEGSDELVRFFAAMNAMGLQDYVRFNAGVVRGLAYYTGTVFEAWDIGGDIRRAILGGGRYDNLLAAVGGEPVAAVGFAMGDVVLGLLLEKYGLLPANLAATPAQVLVTVFDKNLQPTSLTVASELRNAGVNAATYPAVATLQKQFKYADRLGVRFVIVIGSDEVTANEVLVKDLRSGEQERVGRAMVAADLKRRLGDTDATLKGAS